MNHFFYGNFILVISKSIIQLFFLFNNNFFNVNQNI